MHVGEYREFAAPAALDRFVECFWTHEASQRPSVVLPDACMDIVFSRAIGLQVVGTMTRPLVGHGTGNAFVGVRFRTGMARDFIAASATELADRVLPLSDVWGKHGRALEEKLRNTSGAQKMMAALRAALKPPSQLSPIQNAIESLARNAGSISLKEISRHAGLGERQLRRRCLEETGVTPKQLARIARFRRVCSFIPLHSDPDLASLAVECGYYDQAHLIHEFQEFSGSTPGDYVRFLQYR